MPTHGATSPGPLLRRLAPEDSLAELTALLHLAYAPLAAAGMHFVASHQGEATTAQRVAMGECWVAVQDGRLVGTITLTDAARTAGCAWYDRPDVAHFQQFAVAPRLQGEGLGCRMLEHVVARARALGIAELACDTSEHAHALIEWYLRRGFRKVGEAKWDAVNYRSVILSRDLGA